MTAIAPDTPAAPVPPPPDGAAAAAPLGTGSAASRTLGAVALAAVALATLYGLVISPADVEMGDLVRILYVHVPSAVACYVGCFITTGASAMWLWKRTPGWDVLAGAGAELGLLFVTLTLLTGSLWGRPTWGTYWTWDARLTSTALLAVLLIGYLALRMLDLDPDSRSARVPILGLLLMPNVFIVSRSVEWWRSLHQRATITTLHPQIEGDLMVALMTGFLAVALVFTWLLVHRFRVSWLEYQAQRVDLDQALDARRSEAWAEAGAEASWSVAPPGGPPVAPPVDGEVAR